MIPSLRMIFTLWLSDLFARFQAWSAQRDSAAAIELLPVEERADPLGLQADEGTQPVKPVDTLLCLHCGQRIELKYFGYHVEFCRLKDEFRHKSEDQELPY